MIEVIQHNNREYKWSNTYEGYFGRETSNGSYGAVLSDGLWYPAILDDSGHEISDAESFPDAYSAIAQSFQIWT